MHCSKLHYFVPNRRGAWQCRCMGIRASGWLSVKLIPHSLTKNVVGTLNQVEHHVNTCEDCLIRSHEKGKMSTQKKHHKLSTAASHNQLLHKASNKYPATTDFQPYLMHVTASKTNHGWSVAGFVEVYYKHLKKKARKNTKDTRVTTWLGLHTRCF